MQPVEYYARGTGGDERGGGHSAGWGDNLGRDEGVGIACGSAEVEGGRGSAKDSDCAGGIVGKGKASMKRIRASGQPSLLYIYDLRRAFSVPVIVFRRRQCFVYGVAAFWSVLCSKTCRSKYHLSVEPVVVTVLDACECPCRKPMEWGKVFAITRGREMRSSIKASSFA